MPSSITKIAVIGTGVIGAGWIIRSLAHNKKFTAFDKDIKLKKKLIKEIKRAWPYVKKLFNKKKLNLNKLKFVDLMPEGSHWSGFAISKMEMPYVAQTVLLGGNVRVGLEDNLYLKKGVLASNAQLVEKAIRIITDMGATTLTPEETRQKLKLKKHK